MSDLGRKDFSTKAKEEIVSPPLYLHSLFEVRFTNIVILDPRQLQVYRPEAQGGSH